MLDDLLCCQVCRRELHKHEDLISIKTRGECVACHSLLIDIFGKEGREMNERIHKLIIDFDFEKVHTAMTAVNWQWKINENETRVPTVTELQNEAIRLIKDATKSGWTHRTGGFMAGWDRQEDELFLQFIFEVSTA